MGRVDGYNPQNNRRDAAFSWTDVYEKNPNSSSATIVEERQGFILFFLFLTLERALVGYATPISK